MGKPSKWLASRNAIDGLLYGVDANMQQAARVVAEECGYHPDHPHPFYPLEVGLCIARGLCKLLYPELDEASAQFRLGYACSRGYGQTIVGMAALAQSRKLDLGNVLHYIMNLTQRETPYMNYQINQVDTNHYQIEVFNMPQHPSFLAGALTYSMEVNGATQPTCTITVKDEMRYLYELSW